MISVGIDEVNDNNVVLIRASDPPCFFVMTPDECANVHAQLGGALARLGYANPTASGPVVFNTDDTPASKNEVG